MLFFNRVKNPRSTVILWAARGWNEHGLGRGGYFIKLKDLIKRDMFRSFLLVSWHMIALPILIVLSVVYMAHWAPKQWLEILIALWVAKKLILG